MKSAQVTIRVHANYVQTCVRFYGDTTLSYNESARFGADAPKAVVDSSDVGALRELMTGWQSERYDERMPYFPEFSGFLEIRYTIPDPDTNEFFVEEARHVDPKHGGRNIRGAFQNEKFKRAILVNITNAIYDKNANKLNEILKALNVVGG